MLVSAKLEHSSETVMAHMALDCVGRSCPLHNRSEHSMRAWQQIWRSDIRIVERVCPHGVGHPDPDQFAFWDAKGILTEKLRHGCDGCCTRHSARTLTRSEVIDEMTRVITVMNMGTEDVIPIRDEVSVALDAVLPTILFALAFDVKDAFDEGSGIPHLVEYIKRWRPSE